jgi:arginyl-tRNA synthetase
MVQELKEKGIAVESDGAQCIFVGKKKGPPLMVQKSDGGFGYAATDLAALRYRVNEVKCNRIVYVTDVGQELHFKQVFEGGEKCGFVDPKVTKLDHMMFGMVLQENVSVDDEGNEVKKAEKIKTREGKSTKLSELLDEARDRALKAFEERAKAKAEGAETEVRSEDLDAAAEILGISSIKYFDLKQNRT